MLLAQRGSGQALYIGLGDGIYVVASEPYGLVAECTSYVRLDGETMLEPGNPATQGQVVVLDRTLAGTLAGIRRVSYDGRELPVTELDVHEAQITTRDVDRGDAPHYLLKEISEAPASFRKTLRGKVVDHDGQLVVRLPVETMTEAVRARLTSGDVRRVLVVGQGTAAIAGQSLARALRGAAADLPISVEALTATELSGFELGADMHDTVVIAISQSGTTTDTNRTVDLARGTRRARDRDRQSSQQRSHRQGRRCAVHVGRSRRRDERGVDQGLLLSGCRGLPARVRDCGRARRARRQCPRVPA